MNNKNNNHKVVKLCIFSLLLLLIAPYNQLISLSAAQEVLQPTIITLSTTRITDTSAKLRAYLVDDGGAPCHVTFAWDDYPLDSECAGLIATGSVVKDNRSIFWKNRHFNANNQKPRFFEGWNYSFIGIGHQEGICRMGINEQGLVIGNFDINGNVAPERRWFLSDKTTGGEDGDLKYVLGNFSTVYDAAISLAQHGTYPSQLGIISKEECVGAIVTIGNDGWTNITWVNNTWVALGNAIHCNGAVDSKMLRIREKITDIIQNQTSCEQNSLIHWKDVIQRLAKDIDSGYSVESEPYGYTGMYYASGINPSTARAAMVAVSGNTSYNGSLNLGWFAFGQTTHLSLFVPLGASYIHNTTDIPLEFTDENGLETYTDIKQAYAEYSPNRYLRQRVHEIHNYTFHNEDMTFNEYSTLMQTITTCADEQEAQQRMKNFASTVFNKALTAYHDNLTWYAQNTTFSETYTTKKRIQFHLTNLIPGTVYYFKVYADNDFFTANSTQQKFMTEPTQPTHLKLSYYFPRRVNISWVKGINAHYTVIERNTIPHWRKGCGIEIYNGTATSYQDTQLIPRQRYYYRLWSFTDAEGLYQYSNRCAVDMIKIPKHHP